MSVSMTAGAQSIVVSPNVLNLSEPDGVGDFTVRLSNQPTGPVTVMVTDEANGPGSDVTVEAPPLASPPSNAAQLVFTPANYSTPQTIRVRVVDDNSANGTHDIIVTSRVTQTTDTAYTQAPPANVTVHIADNELPSAIVVSKTVLNLSEPDGVGEFTVNLSEPPSANVSVSVTDEDNGPASDVTVEAPPAPPPDTNVVTLTFTPTNFATPQTVRVKALNDSSINGTHSVTITSRVTQTTDTTYARAAAVPVVVNIADDDFPSIKLAQSGGTTQVFETNDPTAGGDTYTVVLTSGLSSTQTVTVTPATTPGGQVSISPSSITFNSNTDTTPQTFTVRATDDANAEATPQMVKIVHTVTTNPAGGVYEGMPVDDVDVSITDNDSKVLAFTETNGGTQVRGDLFAPYPDNAGADTYKVYISQRPTDPVTVTLTPSEGLSVNPITLTFNAGDEGFTMNDGQTVTITATAAATGPSKIEHTVTSLDAGYNSLPVRELNVCRVHQDASGTVVATNCVAPPPPPGGGGGGGGALGWLTLAVLLAATGTAGWRRRQTKR